MVRSRGLAVEGSGVCTGLRQEVRTEGLRKSRREDVDGAGVRNGESRCESGQVGEEVTS